ncbi:hypothetical protein GGI15_001957 [Coemansia interrupta]|uniref:BD-FAE-like domain-containing protein n=1 Tax=Coemansia interrupta TaxID=1126814 RepID=A0A9W8HHT4_9FUNG|nr:hypothetical protein GGI15_001957 [Coemansia interrupta]
MRKYEDIAYIDDGDKGHTLDIYLPDTAVTERSSSSSLPLVIYVHGGAWRTDDKSTVSFIGPRLLEETGNCTAIAIVNYRLSTRDPSSVRHPAHLDDVCAAIEFLVTVANYPGHDVINQGSVYLVGHSAGAHLATMAVLGGSHGWLQSIKGVVGIGGIYDIPSLLRKYPSYSDFVDMAFDRSQYAAASPLNAVSAESKRGASGHIRFLVINSTEDELIGSDQAVEFASRLIDAGYEDVALVVRKIGDHYGELERREFWRIISQFVFDKCN